MTRVAALDCGTNSVRMLIADVEPRASGAGDIGTAGGAGAAGGAGGRLTDVVRRMEIVRLGQGVDQTGRLAPQALDRTFAVLRLYAEAISASGAVAVRMVATSATRDAANAAEFTSGVHAILGIDPEVISGDEEAALSFAGATTELADAGSSAAPPGTYLVVDIGGGSTEFVLGVPGGPITGAASVDIGCVRMTERHLHSDPPSRAEITAATNDIDAALEVAAAKLPSAGAATLAGLAGSVTTVAGIALDLAEYEASLIHHARTRAAEVHAVAQRLLASSHAQRATIGVMHPGRVDVIAAGALILDRVMTRFGFPYVLASEHDILDGIAWSLVQHDGGARGADCIRPS
jgi:exopolyphosphatase / guanosine-5'-triphosphate,3'-diphosphate pyrophosphatase